MHRFDNKVALVTGAASGMGKAAAVRLAHEGAKLLLCDINEAGLEETRHVITKAGGTAEPAVFNAMDEDSCNTLAPTAERHFGQLDIVVNAAGISGFYELHEIDAEIFNRFMTINCVAAMCVCKTAMPLLVKSQGCIINFTSINSRLFTAYHTVYCASKAALMAMTKVLALEFAEKGVRVNCISPGSIDTPMNSDIRITDSMDFKKIAKLMSLAKPNGTPEEVAGLVAYLASAEARFINGEDVTIDGATRCSM